MKRTILVALGAVALLGGAALAQDVGGQGDIRGQGQGQGQMQQGQDTGMYPGQQGQTGKQGKQAGSDFNQRFTAVDLYLQNAINNVKVLHQVSTMPVGTDTAIQREALSNLTRALNSAQNHLQRLRNVPQMRADEMEQFNNLQNQVSQARQIASQLNGVIRRNDLPQVQTLTSQLFGVLQQADESFASIADRHEVRRVARIDVPERRPVRGEETQEDLDIGGQKGGQMGGQQGGQGGLSDPQPVEPQR